MDNKICSNISKGKMIRNRYNQIPYMTQDVNVKVSQLQNISFFSQCNQLMNKVTSHSKYNAPTLWYKNKGTCGITLPK